MKLYFGLFGGFWSEIPKTIVNIIYDYYENAKALGYKV